MDVILHLTHDCQLRCVYCYAGKKRGSAMSWEVAQRAIDLVFAQLPSDPSPQISFFGGEPLLALDRIRQCVSYAETRREQTRRAFRLSITTNGLGLDDAAVEYLHVHQVAPTLSFDGVAAAQNASRSYSGGRSSFGDTQRAMTRLLRHFPGLVVCAVVSPENVEHLPESLDFFLGAGVQRLVLNPNFFGNWWPRALEHWRVGYEHAARRFEEALRNDHVLHINFISAKIITHLKGGYAPCDCCDFGTKEIAVAPSGNIYPCQRMVGEDQATLGRMGSVFTGFDPKTCHELACGRTITSPECLECDLRSRCRNWCSCVNHRLTGRFDRVGPLVCFHERMAIEIADRVASKLFAERNSKFLETFYLEKHVSPEWV